MITIEQGESSPYVHIDPDKGKVVLKGNSFTSNPHEFYGSVIEWARSYKVKKGSVLVIDVTMGYYSTSNIQMLNLLFKTLQQNNSGENIALTFYFDREEEEDFEEAILSLVFNTGLHHKRVYI